MGFARAGVLNSILGVPAECRAEFAIGTLLNVFSSRDFQVRCPPYNRGPADRFRRIGPGILAK
jgi:hypothetical protein